MKNPFLCLFSITLFSCIKSIFSIFPKITKKKLVNNIIFKVLVSKDKLRKISYFLNLISRFSLLMFKKQKLIYYTYSEGVFISVGGRLTTLIFFEKSPQQFSTLNVKLILHSCYIEAIFFETMLFPCINKLSFYL